MRCILRRDQIEQGRVARLFVKARARGANAGKSIRRGALRGGKHGRGLVEGNGETISRPTRRQHADFGRIPKQPARTIDLRTGRP